MELIFYKSELLVTFLQYKNGKNIIYRQWIKDGGTRFYPPRSIQALLRIYLTPGVQLNHKHHLLLYFLMDLEEILKTDKKLNI